VRCSSTSQQACQPCESLWLVRLRAWPSQGSIWRWIQSAMHGWVPTIAGVHTSALMSGAGATVAHTPTCVMVVVWLQSKQEAVAPPPASGLGIVALHHVTVYIRLCSLRPATSSGTLQAVSLQQCTHKMAAQLAAQLISEFHVGCWQQAGVAGCPCSCQQVYPSNAAHHSVAVCIDVHVCA
jgi:hypothetical protein